MINLDKIAEELFNKIRGRYPKITIGDEESTITNVPEKARFFDFDFSNGKKVNVTIDEKELVILYNNDLITDATESVKNNWYGFMKELRQFAKKRMLNFDTRDITKTNLDKRDYDYLSQKNRPGENQMSESKLYGTSKTSFQDVGNAKIIVKHNEAVDFENPAGRTQRIHSIYVESGDGERYKYPFKHLNGARAMAQHVSEGGNQYDSFGKHIVSLSEELSKLRTFKTYMNRSSVMAEGLAGYMDIVNERIDSVKETVHKLQRNSYYKEAMANFQETVMEEVPEDVSSNWIDELTIRQFNEDLKGVFPYIYNLVKEGTKSEALTPENLLGEDDDPMDPEVSDEMGDKINAWIEKYSKYEGGYGTMPKGYVKWALDSGIATDFIEENEDEAMEAKYGDAYLNDPWDLKFYNQMPITKACMEELEKITGNDDSDHNARIIDKVMNGDADESADVEEGAVKKALEDDAENLSREEFIKKHGDAEFFDNYNGVEESWFNGLDDVTLNGDEFYENFGWIGDNEENIDEAEYQGRKVKLNKPMRGDVKKFKVYVKNPKGNVVKVNFGDPDMKIKRSNPKRRKSFRARHNCDSPGPKHKARYWSCRKW